MTYPFRGLWERARVQKKPLQPPSFGSCVAFDRQIAAGEPGYSTGCSDGVQVARPGPAAKVNLLDMRENSFQLIEAVVADDQFAMALCGVLNAHVGTEPLGQVIL